MSVIERMINDSVVLTGMVGMDPEEMKNISVKELNDKINNYEKIPSQNVVDRVSKLYPTDSVNVYSSLNFLQALEDTNYLISSKRIELLVFFYFKYKEEGKLYKFEIMISNLPDELIYDYEHINFGKDLKQTILRNDLIDLIHLEDYTFNSDDLYEACNYGSLYVSKYIIAYLRSLIRYINSNFSVTHTFTSACKGGNIKLVKYILDDYEEKNIKVNVVLGLENACQSGNIELFNYILSFGYLDRILNTPTYFLADAIISGNVDMVALIYNICVDNGITFTFNDEYYFLVKLIIRSNIDILKYIISVSENTIDFDILLNIACDELNLEMIKYILSLNKSDIHNRDDHPLIVVNKNLELFKYIVEYNTRNNGTPFNFHASKDYLFKTSSPDVLEYIKENI